jgi:hypothetical protein
MRKLTVFILALGLSMSVSAKETRCTIQQISDIIFKVGKTSSTPDIMDIGESGKAAFILDKNTVTSNKTGKTVWMWTTYLEGTKESQAPVEKMRMEFSSTDPEIYRASAYVTFDCFGNLLTNEVATTDWMSMSVGSPVYVARRTIYGKGF